MLFKPGSAKDPNRLEREYENEIHPDLRTVLVELQRFSRTEGLPQPMVTELVRTRAEQVDIYVAFWRKLLASDAPGPHHGMVDLEGDGTWRKLFQSEMKVLVWLRVTIAAAIAAEEKRLLKTLSIEERAAVQLDTLDRFAADKATWHSFRCAADLRTVGDPARPHYTKAERTKVFEFLAVRCKKPQWELLEHDVTAPHIHIARRDFSWRARGPAA